MSIALITGATAGFGRAMAHKFASGGWDVIINGRRKERLDELRTEIIQKYGVRALPLPFDVRNRDDVFSQIGALPADWKNIDLLVNNAGLALGLSTIQEGDPDDWDVMIDTNVKGLLYVSRAVMPGMTERGQGHIINIGSLAGKEAYSKGNVYCSTKFAVDALTRSMRIDLLQHGIRVTAIHPGAAETEFSLVRYKGDTERAKNVYRGYDPLTPEDIAEIAWFAATLPRHVVLNDILVTPLAQANTSHFLKTS